MLPMDKLYFRIETVDHSVQLKCPIRIVGAAPLPANARQGCPSEESWGQLDRCDFCAENRLFMEEDMATDSILRVVIVYGLVASMLLWLFF
jgi:hypothetical protein